MSDVASQLFEREAIRELIARVGRLLDTKDFAAVIASFAEPGSYVLRAYSPEIGKELIWMSVKRAELLRLLKESAEHVHDLADRTHQITVDQISLEKGEALARSTFSVFRTDMKGQSDLFAVGHYEDRLVKNGDTWLIDSRTVRLHTRMFTVPTPLPL